MKKIFFLLSVSFLFLTLKISGQNLIGFSHVLSDQKNFNQNFFSIVQDTVGFIWIGSNRGLYRYDGYSFKQFRINSLNENNEHKTVVVKCLFLDSEGNLWVGTLGSGLARYLPLKESFIVYTHDDNILTSIGADYINDITEDKSGNLWIGLRRGGLSRLDPEKGEFINFIHDSTVQHSLFSNDITTLHVDEKNRLWLGSWQNGLGMVDLKKQNLRFQHFSPDKDTNFRIGGYKISDITEGPAGAVFVGIQDYGIQVYDENVHKFYDYYFQKEGIRSLSHEEGNHLWIGTESGLYKTTYSPLKNKNQSFIYSPGSYKNLPIRSATDVYIDIQKNIWVCSNDEIAKGSYNKFEHIQIIDNIDRDSRSNNITSFAKSDEDNVYISTWGEGIWSFNYTHNDSFNQVFNQIDEQFIRFIYKGTNGDYFIAPKQNGFYHFVAKSKQLKHVSLKSNDRYNVDQNTVTVILEDFQHKYWIGTANGIFHYDPVSGTTRHYNCVDIKGNLIHSYIKDLLLDSEGALWIGTLQSGLLQKINESENKIICRQYIPDKNQTSLSGFNVNSIFEDNEGVIWIGMANGGLNQIVKTKDTVQFKRFTINEGLASIRISSILEDDYGRIWITTSEGISFFDKTKQVFISYNKENGLFNTHFGVNSAIKHDGILFFGGNNGFNAVYPQNVKYLTTKNKIYITNFKVLNNDVSPSQTSDNGVLLLDKSILFSDHITLSYLENTFTFEFSTLDFKSPSNIKYAYKLEQYEKEWNIVDATVRAAKYTQVPPGIYTLLVKSTNSNGVWGDYVKRIQIVIKPPFWKSQYAIYLYIAFIILIVLVIQRFTFIRTNLRSKIKYEKLMREKDQEITKQKLQFFTNIAHEFKTPLTLIIDPIEQLIRAVQDNHIHQKLTLIQTNATRLLHLIEQLMDFRRIDSGNLKLVYTKIDIISHINEILKSFDTYVTKKGVNLLFKPEIDFLEGFFDLDKLDKILFNLLSNAIRSESKGGFVIITLKVFTSKPVEKINQSTPALYNIEVSVQDNGKGISEENLPKIFDRFYKVSSTNYGGTGVGLAIVKDYIDLIGGSICVNSKLNEGTVFTFSLPLLKSVDESDIAEYASESISNSIIFDTIIDTDEGKPEADMNCTLLIVEDNEELRKYLSECFQPEYNVIEAADGIEGFEKAKQYFPDLIISDVMMPNEDGLSLCAKTKSDFDTCHIPFIILTALSSDSDIISGIEKGADSYIRKPFSFKYLEVTVKNLIESRRVLRERYSTDISMRPTDIAFTTQDEDFINKATNIILENIENSEFDIEDFSEATAFSRSHLFRKLKGITNQSPSEFIRTIRLKKAAQLLSQDKYSVSEIADKCGFNSPSYFTQSFKKHFKISPKEYTELSLKENEKNSPQG